MKSCREPAVSRTGSDPFRFENAGREQIGHYYFVVVRGVLTGSGGRGISHCDEVDLRRKRLSRRQGDGVSDITEVYLDIVNDLGSRGF